MSDILEKIVASKRREVDESRRRTNEADLARSAASRPAVRNFESALRQPGIQVIAEVKKASPSAGVIRADFDPVAIARTYERHGAACISVLTDEPFFHGRLEYLTQVRDAVSTPVLRKDFVIDAYQLIEARAAGADAVLLIAEILPGPQLRDLYLRACDLGLHVLMELHDAEQLDRVLETRAPIVGINNRNLRTFETRLDHTLNMLDRIPKDRCVVSESGIRSHADLTRLQSAGVQAVLVGESLMRSPDIGRSMDTLLGR